MLKKLSQNPYVLLGLAIIAITLFFGGIYYLFTDAARYASYGNSSSNEFWYWPLLF